MDEGCLTIEPDNLEDDPVNLSVDDRNRLYTPWNSSVILKAFGRKFTQQYLNTKLEALWKLPEPLFLLI